MPAHQPDKKSLGYGGIAVRWLAVGLVAASISGNLVANFALLVFMADS